MAGRSCLAKGEAGAREGRRVSIATDLNSTLLISPCLSKSEARELFFADPSSMEYEETPSPERAPADVYAARAAELDAARAAACASAIAAARRAADRSMARSKLLAQQDDDAENTPPQRSPAVSPPQKAAVTSPLSMRAMLVAEPLTRAQREERDIEALSVDELKQRIVATARRRRERRAQLQVAEAYVY